MKENVCTLRLERGLRLATETEEVVDLGRTERSLLCCHGAWGTYF